MKDSDSKKFRHQLEKAKKEIEGKLKELEKPPEFGAETYDEETDESQSYANQLSVREIFKSRLADVTRALQKITEGRYGICEKCGNAIDPVLLELVPESRLCKDCKRLLK